MAINGDQHGDEREIIYHEYIHYVMHNNYAALPLWLHEGLAEYYSTFQVARDEARIGLPVPAHVLWLRQHTLIPLATLFAVDERSPEYNETSRRGGFYAESWALVHYLISGSPERRRQAAEYLRLRAGRRAAGPALRPGVRRRSRRPRDASCAPTCRSACSITAGRPSGRRRTSR